MDHALLIHRLHFAFTVTFHYLFPMLTMGLAPIILALKSIAILTDDDRYDDAARFWAKIFGINFAIGVVTGIPMEFQFGTNWSHFARFAGGVIGQTLAMEGTFSFFLESAFLGMFLYGEKKLSPWMHWFAGLGVFLGSWLSGFFIIATDAWMQHPVGYTQNPDGSFTLNSLSALLLNPWAWAQYAHNMCGALVVGAFVVSAVGAYYLLTKQHQDHGKLFVATGVCFGLIACVVQVVPTGDIQGKMVAVNQPATLAAMEAMFKTDRFAPMVIIGQPNVDEKRLDNTIQVPGVLSFLTYKRWNAEVKGLDQFKPEDVTDSIALLYYAYHIMVGLGTIFIAIMFLAAFLLWRQKLFEARWMLWVLMLSFPFPYIANTAGWITAEVGRQPWLVYGLMRTANGYSHQVSAGNGMFTLLGFMGLYMLLGLLFLFMVGREVAHGPERARSTQRLTAAVGR